jgi:hypothetical protein
MKEITLIDISDNSFECSNCGKPRMSSVGQFLKNGLLRWTASYYCPDCLESRVEAEGGGLPPSDIRTRLLAKYGWWRLAIYIDKLKSVNILGDALALSQDHRHALVELMPAIIILGTKTEMEWLALILADAQVQGFLEPAPDGPAGIDFASLWNENSLSANSTFYEQQSGTLGD